MDIRKAMLIDIDTFPYIKQLLEFCEYVRTVKTDNPDWYEVSSIDVKLVNGKEDLIKESKYYNELGLQTTMGADCTYYFSNSPSNGFCPTGYGYWTTVYPEELQNDSANRLEYFLSNNIMKPFRINFFSSEDKQYHMYML